MKFPATFTRWVSGAAGTIALGSDALLVDADSNPRPAARTDDNAFSSRIVSINGWPISRVAVAAKYTGEGVPVAANIAMYVFEDNLRIWLPLSQSAMTITPGTATAPTGFVFFDAVTLTDLPHVRGELGAAEPGSATYLCIVDNNGSPPDGRYDFIMGAELTTKPF